MTTETTAQLVQLQPYPDLPLTVRSLAEGRFAAVESFFACRVSGRRSRECR
jgi:hypothetical protein